MTSFFIQGFARVEPAINPEFAHWLFREALQPYGIGSIGCVADQGGSVMQISQTVEATTAEAAVKSFTTRFNQAVERRMREARVIRFSIGRFEPGWISAWSADGSVLSTPRPLAAR